MVVRALRLLGEVARRHLHGSRADSELLLRSAGHVLLGRCEVLAVVVHCWILLAIARGGQILVYVVVYILGVADLSVVAVGDGLLLLVARGSAGPQGGFRDQSV